MTKAKFKSLKVGDTVTLAIALPIYHERDRTVPAGTKGIVGAVWVPAVRGRERYFACVDFPELAQNYLSYSGESLTSVPRVGAYPEDLQ